MPTNIDPSPSPNGSAAAHTVVEEPPKGSTPWGDFIIYASSQADEFPPWGTQPRGRDFKLRQFWVTEPILASAIFSTVSRYAAFGWRLTGPPRMKSITERVLHSSEHGKGWLPFIVRLLTDLFTTDNGAFYEIVRTDDSPTAPVVQLNHLDSGRCIRTGRWDVPIHYWSLLGKIHEIPWYRVGELTEFPSPIEEARGMQYCVVTRLLRAAQIMRDISIFKHEKISGRFAGAIHLVSGVQRQTITDALLEHRIKADNQGLMRYVLPAVIASLDPTAKVSKETLELASLPDQFNEEESMRWYVNQLALAFGGDYQDYAPLPGGNLGTSQQSETLHMKSRGKGPRLFMSMLEHQFNFHGIIPNSVKFEYGDQDVAEDVEHAKLAAIHAETIQMLIKAGAIDGVIGRQILADYGELDPKYLEQLGEKDLTPATNEPSDADNADNSDANAASSTSPVAAP